jgi:uncharacterized protein YqgC (DUF456 family)
MVTCQPRRYRRGVLEAVVLVVMLAGLVGVLIPVLPGLPLIVAGGVVWAWAGDAGATGWVVAVVIAAAGIAGMVVAAVLPAKRGLAAGVPRWVLATAAVGVVIGFFVIPVVGALVGGPVALFVVEWLRLRDLNVAWRSTKEALKGIGLGIVVQLVAGVGMIAVWAFGVWIS